MKTRLDHYLAEKGLAKTRSQAQLLIKEGKVKVNAKNITKVGFLVGEEKVTLEAGESYVGRGAFKMKAAIEAFGIEVKGKVIADCGASTGGFTDYLLKHGVKKSYCIDVGHDQLDPLLMKDKRVVNKEGINLKNPLELPEKVDIVVADLSFISLRLVINTLVSFLKESGALILLFKPQFELGKGKVNKQGVVKNELLRKKALDEFTVWCKEKGLSTVGVIDSPIEGKKGNREYLIHMKY